MIIRRMRSLILLTFFLSSIANAQTLTCPCEFEVELRGVDAAVPARMKGYTDYGKGVKSRRVAQAPLWYPDSLKGETPMEPTAQWFTEHSACGNDLYCVEKVTYENLILDTYPPGTAYQHVHVRIKLRKR